MTTQSYTYKPDDAIKVPSDDLFHLTGAVLSETVPDGLPGPQVFARVADAITDTPEEADRLQQQYDERAARAAAEIARSTHTE